MSWRKTIRKETPQEAKSWRDTIQREATPDVSQLESGVRGLAQGASLGFADEITGGVEALFTDKTYDDARDEAREAYRAAEEANPLTYGAGNVAGAVGTAFLVPGAGAAGLAGRVGSAALAGGVAGVGSSEAEGGQLAVDAAKGAALGGAFQGGFEKVVAPIARGGMRIADDILNTAVTKAAPAVEKYAPKLANKLAGIDEDAALRQLQRPMQTAAAEVDGFSHKVGARAVRETGEKGQQLGERVQQAEMNLLEESGDLVHEGAQDLAKNIDKFLLKNAESPMGFSAIDKGQREELSELAKKIRSNDVSTEDLVKFRKYLDHVERLAGKYDKEGTSPYVNFLKSLRHDADVMLDNFDPQFDSANKAYGQYMDDVGTLRSAKNEGRAESMIDNLYGRNKGAQQQAAARLFSPQTMEQAKDIAANKAFDNAQRPGGENYFRRGALAVVSTGVSELVTAPNVWKGGLRHFARFEQALHSNPQVFGKYAGVLTKALERGPQSVAATHFLLSQRDQSYRQLVEQMNTEEAK